MLIADDDVALRAALSLIAKGAGLSVVESCVCDMPQLCRSACPDVILLNVTQGSSGLTALRTLHFAPSTGRIPIVALTDDVKGPPRTLCYSSGASAVVTNPLVRTFIATVVRLAKEANWVSVLDRAPQRDG